jgi:hypothetical protein
MTCSEIENRLPAYLEGLLSPEEKKSLALHIASCPRCSRALADLEKTEKLVQGLTEVEPPPFFEQRIMSRVREEAGRRQGILRRLFYPLHIKLPIQALATIVVAVLAYHVYQQGDSEMKRMAPLMVPLTEQGGIQVESPKTPASPPTATPFKRSPAPARDLPEMRPQRFASPLSPPFEKWESGERSAGSRAPIQGESPAAAKPAAPVMAAKEKDIPSSREEGFGKVQDRTGREDSAKAIETLSPEARREKAAAAGAVSREDRQTGAAPAPTRMTAAAIHRSAMELTIQVRDLEAALRELESRLNRVSARIIERQHRSEGEFLKAEVDAQRVAALLDLLEAIGKVHLETGASAVPAGTVTVGITVVGNP